MTLIRTDAMDIGVNHQVLAYAYRKSGQKVELTIYDPNKEIPVTLSFDITSTSGEVHINSSHSDHRIFCFFRTNGYTPKLPPLGRRFTSIRDALAAITDTPPPYAIRSMINNGDRLGHIFVVGFKILFRPVQKHANLVKLLCFQGSFPRFPD
ncbi:hypothetical protein HC928_23610 [bacterium]|nr:hypothetical protein [bacterium]